MRLLKTFCDELVSMFFPASFAAIVLIPMSCSLAIRGVMTVTLLSSGSSFKDLLCAVLTRAVDAEIFVSLLERILPCNRHVMSCRSITASSACQVAVGRRCMKSQQIQMTSRKTHDACKLHGNTAIVYDSSHLAETATRSVCAAHR